MVDQPRSPPRKPLKTKGTLSLPPVDEAMNKRAPINTPPDNKGALKDGPPNPDDARPKMPGPKPEEDEEIIERIIKRFERCVAAESDNRKAAVDDLKFKAGNQWPADVMTQRSTDKRPCLTVNKIPVFISQVTNSQRENRPSINVSPVGDKGDKDAAKMYRGLIRAIERNSRAEIAYDTAFDNAVTNGWGYIRILTDWESETSFNQTILIKRVRNPFTVYADPDAQEPDGSDWRFGIITEIIPTDEFKQEYPDAQPVPWQLGGTGERYKAWTTKDGIRVAEYYEVKTEPEDLVKLSTGWEGYRGDVDPATEARIKDGTIKIRDTRKSYRRRVDYYKVNCVEILERKEWLGKWIPIVPVIGTEIDIEGKVTLSGVVRNAKDAQRMLNYWTTSEAEMVALAPKAPFILEEGQLEGHERQWKNANVKSYPYLLYKGTSIGGRPAPPPQRQAPGAVPAGIVQAKQGAAADMMSTTGIRYDPNVMPADLRESGRLVQENRRNSDIGSFHYIDNLGRSLKFIGDQLVDLIPKIYDDKQVVTILREDDTEEQMTLDPLAPKAYDEVKGAKGTTKVFNPKVGQYGVTVDIGPSYATKRIEAAQSMMEFVKAMPNTAQLVMDLIANEMDWPGADKIAARLAKAIPPQLLTPDQKDMTPQVQALLQSMEQKTKELTQQLQAALHALEDKTQDRQVAMEKIAKDFEAKIIATIEKAETGAAKIHAENLRSAIDTLEKRGDREHQEKMAQTGMAHEDIQGEKARAAKPKKEKPNA